MVVTVAGVMLRRTVKVLTMAALVVAVVAVVAAETVEATVAPTSDFISGLSDCCLCFSKLFSPFPPQ